MNEAPQAEETGPRVGLVTFAALIAGHAVGIFPDLALAARTRSKIEDETRPDWAANGIYKPYVALYPTLFENNRDTFEVLAGIMTGTTGFSRGE